MWCIMLSLLHNWMTCFLSPCLSGMEWKSCAVSSDDMIQVLLSGDNNGQGDFQVVCDIPLSWYVACRCHKLGLLFYEVLVLVYEFFWSMIWVSQNFSNWFPSKPLTFFHNTPVKTWLRVWVAATPSLKDGSFCIFFVGINPLIYMLMLQFHNAHKMTSLPATRCCSSRSSH